MKKKKGKKTLLIGIPIFFNEYDDYLLVERTFEDVERYHV
jgi:hypothetical protein